MQEEFVYWCAAGEDGGRRAGVTLTTCSAVYGVRNTISTKGLCNT